MAIPDYQTLMLPLLKACAKGPIHRKEAYDQLAREFQLTQEEITHPLPSGGLLFQNRVNWASTYLFRAGLIERPKRGFMNITERGRETLKNPPGRIDNKFLSQFDEFLRFAGRSRSEHQSQSGSGEEETINDSISGQENNSGTPEERIDSAYEEITSTLRNDLLVKVQGMEPTDFEKLIIHLMTSLGYGQNGSAQHLGKSHDGGVDGVINEDRLGLNKIYLQAKRYADDNVIGVEQIRSFAGALIEKRVSKGVFVTTSRFAQGAKDFVKNNPSIVLMDGQELTRLMVDHGVGVRTIRTIEMKKIDLEYFEAFEE
ncbi:MAG: restriction endonuclease [Deltaproteobacteria bacterium]|nr:restriction endonuclease [Deltaproteobacteria bacterium]